MDAVVMNFRGGRHTKYDKHMIIKVLDKIENREAAQKLIGKKVIWKSPSGKELTGKVSNVHGNKGCVRVIFDTGLPGQALGTKVQVI